MNDLREKTVCFTGHREIPSLKVEAVKSKLKTILIEMIDQGYCYFCAGGALGFDTMAAQTVLELREKYPQIRLVLILPCYSQADRWSEADKRIYEDIKSKADKCVYTSKEYTRGCMHVRNRHLVDNSSACVCYLTEKTGGTAYTVSYAKSKGLEIKNISEE